jgi:anti-sigma factor RsiW
MAARLVVCRDLVELVTDYLDVALAPAVRAAADQHLGDCVGCTAYVSQLRATVRLLVAFGGRAAGTARVRPRSP